MSNTLQSLKAPVSKVDIAVINVAISDADSALRTRELLSKSVDQTSVQCHVPIKNVGPETPLLIISESLRVALEAQQWAQEHDVASISFLYIGAEADEAFQAINKIQEFSAVASATCLDENFGHTVRRMLYSLIADQHRTLIGQKKHLLHVIEGVKKQLSVFYHNINNPLTVLSGNIQLLQILSESAELSNEIEKSIQDIGEIATRFETDLKIISELRESIRSIT